MQWYVLRVAANKEAQVKDALVQKVDREGLTDIIGRIEVPVERIKRIRGNKQTGSFIPVMFLWKWNRPRTAGSRKKRGS